jgi:UDP-N-acetylglucosamine acyltransferase
LNHIHETAILKGRIQLGDNNRIGAYTVITGPVTIGDNNDIGSHVVIGSGPEDKTFNETKFNDKEIVIGDNNTIREYTAIQKPSATNLTSINDDCYIMRNCHIPHDARIGSGVTMSPYATLGGHTIVQNNVTIGIAACTHQFTVLGEGCMIAMNATVTKNIPPFTTFIPGKPLKINTVGLQRNGLDEIADDLQHWLQTSEYPEMFDYLLWDAPKEWEALHVESGRQKMVMENDSANRRGLA